MAAAKAHKARFNLLGYGAITLYIALLAVVAAGVYGFSLTSVITTLRGSAETRAQMRTGRMVITTEDRTQCRSLHFDNETSALSSETVMDCDDAKADRGNSGGSYNIFRHSFTGQ